MELFNWLIGGVFMDMNDNKAVKFVSEEIAKVLNQSPKEVQSDIMDISSKSFKILWRPNNYRREMLIREGVDIGFDKLKVIYDDFKISKKNLVFVRDYPDVLLIVGRKKLQGVYCQPLVDGKKVVSVIERSSIVELQGVVDDRKSEIMQKIDFAMLDFARKLKVVKVFSPISWLRHEDWVKGEDFLPKLPVHLLMHDTIFKKVYSDDGLEFVGGRGQEPVVHLKNYVANHALKAVAPEIVQALDSLALEIASFKRVELDCLVEVQSLVKVFPDDFFREDVAAKVRLLCFDDRVLLSDWCFERFGGFV